MRKFQVFTSKLPSFHPKVWKNTVVHGKVIFHQFRPKMATQGLCIQDFVTAEWKEFLF